MKKNNIHILVVNLERSQERRRFMEEQLNKLGLKFSFFSAIDGYKLVDSELKNYSRKQSLKIKGRELRFTEIGCYLSHVKIWEELIKKKYQKLLILEDDIILGKSFVEVLNNLQKLPKDWELINFNTDIALEPFGDFIFDIHRVARFNKYANRLSTYLINKAGAQKLLNQAYPIRMTIDDLTGRTHITNLVSYGVYPQTVVLSDFKSDTWDSPQKLRISKLYRCKEITRRMAVTIYKIYQYINRLCVR